MRFVEIWGLSNAYPHFYDLTMDHVKSEKIG